MMMRLMIIGLLALACRVPVLAAAPDAPGAPGAQGVVQPYQLLRALDHIHDEIVQGSLPAHELRGKMLVYIAQRFAQTDPVYWEKPVNARAAVSFGLNGGSPTALAHILQTKTLPVPFDGLALAALAFGQGQSIKALEMFEEVELTGFPSDFVGLIALIKSQLLETGQTEKQLEYLTLARRLLPGTLVEETALRRMLKLAAAQNDIDLAGGVARHYLRRFENSIYRSQFDDQLNSLLARQDLPRAAEFSKDLSLVVSTMSPQRQCEYHLMMGRDALVRGKLDLSSLATQRADGVCPADGRLRKALDLYSLIANLNASSQQPGYSETIHQDDLAPADQRLFAAFNLVAQTIAAPADPIGTGENRAMSPDTPAMKRALQLLTSSDELME